MCLLAPGRADAAGEVVLRAADAAVVNGTWTVVSDASASGGARLSNPDLGVPKLAEALPAPANYFELTFTADAGTPYHLWLRARAQDDGYFNDSVFVQFSDSLNASGAPAWRIGSTSSTSVVLEDCYACGVSGWGWQDNFYGGLAAPIYFASSGTHTIRIQVREDGLSIDQIVLSASTYLNSPPGSATNDTTILTGSGPALPPPPSSAALVHGPYLQQVRDRSAVIVWASREPGPAEVHLASQVFAATTTFFSSSRTGVADYYQHEALVTGLAPSTAYQYQAFVGGVAATSGGHQIRTAPDAGSGTVRFIAFGDSGTGSPEQAALAAQMTRETFDLALHTGDLAYGNSEGTGAATYATYQSWFFAVYGAWLGNSPLFPSMGNHDSRSANNWGQAYLDLFSLPGNGGGGAYPDNAERYYSFDYGPVHFVALDTELAFQDPDRRAAQLAWLEADLTAAAWQPWKIAFFHRSPYSAGGEHGSDAAIRGAFGPIFERHGVQLSLSAHEHIYERTVPWRTGASADNQAVTYVVAGGGGGPLYPAGQDGWTAASASAHHYVRVTVNGCHATIEAVRPTGAILDATVLDRCAQAADAAPPSVDFVGLSPGMAVSGLISVDASAGDDIAIEKVDLWVDGTLYGIDRAAPYAFTWDAAATGEGSHTLELRAYDIDGNRTSRTVVVTVVSGGGSSGLPAGWQSQDVGAVGLAGTASHASGTFTVSAAGADIWGAIDGFRYTYRSLQGDGAIVARVVSVSGIEPWTKAGVMIRASSAPDAAHASMIVSLGRGLAFQRRTTTGALSTHTAGPGAGAAYWVKLARTGQVVTASVSPDGQSWTVVGEDLVAMPASALVGLAVTSHTTSALAVATFDSVSIATTQALPATWRSDDVGAVSLGGSAVESGGAFAVAGAGADVWGTADAFHFVSQELQGNGTIVARVASVDAVNAWTKAGVMLRATLDPDSSHAFMLVSAARGVAFQRRTATGGLTTHTAAQSSTSRWVRLVRRGQTVTASTSFDGVTWSEVGSDTLAFDGPVRVGLAVTSHDASQLATGVFDNVTVVAEP
jgi:regulation of enolase protein 1 (concanavalin A-like superfamily)